MTEEFVLLRSFDAPRDAVWKAWTERDRMTQWWGPKGVAMRLDKFDLRPGGMCHYAMKTPDGHEIWGKAIYREIVPPERLVSVISFSDANAGMTRHPMSPTWPMEMLTTIEFAAEGPKTNVTVRWLPINASAEEMKTFDEGRDSMKMGWTGTMDQLHDYLAAQKK